MKEYKSIIFDFDGVIGDSFEYAVEVIYKNVKAYTKLRLTKEEILREIREVSIFDILESYRIPRFLVPLIAFKIKRDLLKRIGHIKPFNNAINEIETLSKTHDLFLLTSNSKINVLNFLNNYNIKSEFKVIITSSSFLNKSKSIEKLVKKQKLDKNTTLYVGDEVRDIIACQKIGIDIAVVTYGFNSKNLLEKYNPTYIINSIGNLDIEL